MWAKTHSLGEILESWKIGLEGVDESLDPGLVFGHAEVPVDKRRLDNL